MDLRYSFGIFGNASPPKLAGGLQHGTVGGQAEPFIGIPKGKDEGEMQWLAKESAGLPKNPQFWDVGCSWPGPGERCQVLTTLLKIIQDPQVTTSQELEPMIEGVDEAIESAKSEVVSHPLKMEIEIEEEIKEDAKICKNCVAVCGHVLTWLQRMTKHVAKNVERNRTKSIWSAQ